MGNLGLFNNEVQLVNKERKMTKYPYSTTHYHCGCHIIEMSPGLTDTSRSIFCEDTEFLSRLNKCLYLLVLTVRRQQAARLT